MERYVDDVNRDLGQKAERRKQSPLAWAIGWFFFVLLMGLLIFYYGFTNQFNQVTGSDGSTKPNVATRPTK